MHRYLLSFILTMLICLPMQQAWCQLPDSPTGRGGNALIAALRDGGEANIREFVRSRLDAGLIASTSEDAWVNFIVRLGEELGEFEVAKVAKTADTSAELGLMTNSGAILNISYSVGVEPPHAITRLDVDDAPEPAATFRTMTELKTHLKEATANDRFSGVVLVARQGEIVFHEAYGMASRRYRVPNRLDTRFNIGSNNKDFTAVAILQLAENGKLDLDAPIGNYVSGFPAEIADKVTVRHLLRHEAGWSSYWENSYYLANWSSLRSVEDYMKFIREIPLEFEPGTNQRYSNTGYQVLGAIIESVSGEDYYDYVRRNVHEPVGMNDTDCYERDLPVPNVATGYTRHGQTGSANSELRENIYFHMAKGTPAGGGFSTAVDLFRFDRALRDNRLLSEPYTNLLFNNFRKGATTTRGGAAGYAGGAPGINATWEVDLDRDLAVIVLANMDPPAAEQLGMQIMRMISESEQ